MTLNDPISVALQESIDQHIRCQQPRKLDQERNCAGKGVYRIAMGNLFHGRVEASAQVQNRKRKSN